MSKRARIEWRFGGVAPATAGMEAVALVLSLDDPAASPLWSLEPSRQDEADLSYAGASSRHRFYERRALLRALVAAQLHCAPDEVIIGYDSAGAPRILSPECPFHVSVAGRDELAAAAVSASAVGVDLEPLDREAEPVAAVLHPNEIASLEALEPGSRGEAFLRIWTMKEAYLKALRTGLNCDPVGVEIRAEDARTARIFDNVSDAQCLASWTLTEIGGRPVIAACVALDV